VAVQSKGVGQRVLDCWDRGFECAKDTDFRLLCCVLCR